METFEMLDKAGCDMEVVCDKKWNDLTKTDVDGIRFCADCKKSVFYTTTPAELRIAAERKLCVYIVPDSSASVAKSRQPFKQFDVSRERIREIEAKALRRMKGPTLGAAIIRRFD
jgi:hypothetical protein